MAWYEKITDSLVRADANPIGAPWVTVYGAYYSATKLESNVLQCSLSADNQAYVYHTTPLDSSNNYCQATLWHSVASARSYSAITCRVNSPSTQDTCYAALFCPEVALNYWRFYRNVSGSWTQIGSNMAPDPQSGDVWRISAEGTAIIVTQNGVTKLSTTDAGVSTGVYAGLRPFTGTGSTAGGFQLFSAGDDVAPAGGSVMNSHFFVMLMAGGGR